MKPATILFLFLFAVSAIAQETKARRIFSFSRPSVDCVLVEPPRRVGGVGQWECPVTAQNAVNAGSLRSSSHQKRNIFVRAWRRMMRHKAVIF